MAASRESVGVVGLGYVGLPLALAMVDAGYDVVGVDIDEQRIEQLRAGQSYVNDVADDELQAGLDNGFTPTTDYEALSEVSNISICVPTPLRKTGNPDVSYIVDAAEQLGAVIDRETTVVLESTVYPGATEEVVVPALETNGWTIGEDVFVAFSPERIDPGNEEYGPTEIPKVLGGVTPACGDRAEALYAPVFEEIVRVDSATEAELVKLLENTYRAINIGMVNELATIAHQLEVDIWNVVEAAATKPFGFQPFYPGPGLGGHCIPVDPLYLSWKANQQGIETRFIDLADRINRRMPRHVVRRVTRLLNDEGVAVSTAKVLVVGVAYKPDVSDTRESPAHDIISLLDDRGAAVNYHDPHVPTFDIEGQTYESRELTPKTLSGVDCVILATDHSTVDYTLLMDEAELIFDTRGALDRQAEHVYAL